MFADYLQRLNLGWESRVPRQVVGNLGTTVKFGSKGSGGAVGKIRLGSGFWGKFGRELGSGED